LKNAAFSKHTYDIFTAGLTSVNEYAARFLVVAGSIAATVDDIYNLAQEYECSVVYIDGGYLVRNKNSKLDRYLRVAENVEQMKRYSEDLGLCTFASWQFNREASKKSAKSGVQEGGLEDIACSDAIGQVSSVVLGMFQEDSPETIERREIRVLKGRNGETGKFSIRWDFLKMDFEQCDPPLVEEQIAAPAYI
jgi:replicative DNA helicase